MSADILEVQLLRLSDAVLGYREHEAFIVAQATTPEQQQAVRALLQDLVARGKLRKSEGRFYRVRAAA